jgi:hypothetical protein
LPLSAGALFGSKRAARGRLDALVAVVPADPIARRGITAQHALHDTRAGSTTRRLGWRALTGDVVADVFPSSVRRSAKRPTRSSMRDENGDITTASRDRDERGNAHLPRAAAGCPRAQAPSDGRKPWPPTGAAAQSTFQVSSNYTTPIKRDRAIANRRDETSAQPSRVCWTACRASNTDAR